jgi:protoporphyrinogen oxidase
MKENKVLVIGGGPAGLTAAYALGKQGVRASVLEQGARVGGIARTESYNGYLFDIGGHRFYTKVREIAAIWHEVLGDDFLERPRLSRIFYDGNFYPYPLNLTKTLQNLGAVESARIGMSYLRWRIKPYPQEDSFEEWVTNRFGDRLYQTFFKHYTEKVWGISTTEIRADWAAQRIKGLSLRSAVGQAVFGRSNVTSLIEKFHYPRLGPGMMWERMHTLIERNGGHVCLETRVTDVQHDGTKIVRLSAVRSAAQHNIPVEQLISTMPLSQLIQVLDPPPPPTVLAAAAALNYRDFLIVVLIIDQAQLFPDNWLYIHSRNVSVGRIQNFKNWSAEMVPDAGKTSLGLEYFANEGDALWAQSDDALIALARREIEQLGLAKSADVSDSTVIRQRKAYPVYDSTYHANLQIIRDYLARFGNLQTIGRNGLHRYNNQDHSMLTGLLAARNIMGEDHALWNVNTERSYYEEVVR